MPPPNKAKKTRMANIARANELYKLRREREKACGKVVDYRECISSFSQSYQKLCQDGGEASKMEVKVERFSDEEDDQYENFEENPPPPSSKSKPERNLLKNLLPKGSATLSICTDDHCLSFQDCEEGAHYLRHCFMCFKEVKLHRLSVSEDSDFMAMFILKKMLGLPKESLEEYLTLLGNPSDWITYCQSCLPVITQAFGLQKVINELESKLRNFQERIKRKIKSTCSKKQEKIDKAISEVDANWKIHPLRVTREAWNYVTTGTCSYVEAPSMPNIFQKEDSSLSLESFDTEFTSPSPTPPGSEGPTVPRSSHKKTNYSHLEECEPINPATTLILVKPPPKKRNRGKKPEIPYFNCTLCPNIKAMKITAFVKHIVFHKDRPYQCNVCHKFFTGNEIELAKYSKLTMDIDNLHHCSQETIARVERDPGNCWICAHCPKRFNVEAERNAHEQQLHGKNLPPIISQSCSKCPRKFRSQSEWKLHRALDHPEVAKFGCFYCDEVFIFPTKEDVSILDVRKRRIHIKKQHGPNFTTLDLLDCDLCGSTFRIESEVRDHIIKEHYLEAKQLFGCPICFERWNSVSSFQSHVDRMHSIKPNKEKLVCDICAYVIKDNRTLREHKFQKHGMEPETGIFSCTTQDCLYRTTMKGSLEVHMMKEHNAARRHKCQVCGKEFLNALNLHRHQQIHVNANVKPFQCEVCGNSFAVKNYLYIHMRLSHQNRPFASTHKKKAPRRKKAVSSKPVDVNAHGHEVSSQSNPVHAAETEAQVTAIPEIGEPMSSSTTSSEVVQNYQNYF